MTDWWRAPLGTAVLVGLLAMVTALVGIDARATYGARVSGDEPQYLLTATSLGEDGSLDISDEIAGRRFAAYHEVDLDMQTMELDEAGRQVSPHDPLLPAVLAVPMRLGGWAAAKATLAVIAGLTAGLATWLARRRLDVGAVAAAVAMGAAFGGIPLAAYGTQVYPEMPAALATLVAVAAITGPYAARRPWLAPAVASAAIVVLPWLAVKYAPVAAVLGGFLVWRERGDRRTALTVVGGAVVAGVVYLAGHRLWYGGWTVYATGDHFAASGELSVAGTDIDLAGRARRLTGLLVDRDFGIAAWSPVWFVAPFGLGLLMARPWRGRWLVPAVFAAGWLNATFVALTMHGWWVPGRQIVVVLPLAALGLALVAARGRAWCAAVGALGALGAVNWLWLAAEASTGRRTLIVDFFDIAAWPYRALRGLLPDGLRGGSAATAAMLAVWALLLAVTATAGWRAGSTSDSG
jgi:hypothetical protein